MVNLHPLVVAQVRFLSDALFLIERLMLPTETSCAYYFAVRSRIVLWQHVSDLWPLDGNTKEKWPERVPGLKLRTLSWYP